MQDPTRASITRDHETVQYDEDESPTKSKKKLKKGKNREQEAQMLRDQRKQAEKDK